MYRFQKHTANSFETGYLRQYFYIPQTQDDLEHLCTDQKLTTNYGVQKISQTKTHIAGATQENANHSSFIRNNVVPCICLRVMTYAWSDVTRNAGIRKTNRATRYVGPCIFAHPFNNVTYMINEYNVHIADACYYIAAHALPDAHCVTAL